ncbi:MAG: radical SAM protein [Vicinamibacterales bacterium]
MPAATDRGLFGDPEPPTTRDVARLVKTGGIAALPDAVVRADAATYQHVRCRSALNRARGMPFFKWTLNPYRGCTHGCHYCFARKYQSHLELGAGDEFASVIFVKANVADVLRRELSAWSRPPEQVAIGTATDPYQPIEGTYGITRRCLEALRDHPLPFGIVTKGPMVVRDADLLTDLSRVTTCSVHVSVPSMDHDAWQRLEPGTAPPLQRLRAVRTLVDAGIRCGVMMAPLVPGVTTKPALVEATIKAAADHGASSIGAMVLHLEGGARAHFLRVLAAEYPHLVDGYERLFAGKYAPASYTDEIARVVGLLKARPASRAGGASDRRRRPSCPAQARLHFLPARPPARAGDG